MKNLFCLLVVCGLSLDFLLAQNLDLPVNIQSPVASGLGRFGDIPVSYYTGTPNINIPLFNLNVKGVALPVSLNYDAQGVRVDDHSGWVGQNWTLNAGGVIIRTMRGGSDECSTIGTNYGGGGKNLGFFYTCNSINVNNVNTQSQLLSLAYSASNDGYDYEPDIFTFNFLGKTGKFFLDNDGKWKVLSDENFNIIFDINTDLVQPDGIGDGIIPGTDKKYPKVIGGFKIKDSDGTTYVFGFDPESIEYSIDLFNQILLSAFWKSNAWFLTSVIDKFGNVIYNLTYQRGDNIAQFYRSIGTTTSTYSGGNWIDPSCFGYLNVDINAVEGELISPVYLYNIYSNYNNLSITFHREQTIEMKYDPNDLNYRTNQVFQAFWPNGQTQLNPFYYLGGNITNSNDIINALHWSKLTSIIGPHKLIKLKYNPDNPNERLNLLTLDIYGEDGNYDPNAKKQTYNFHYNDYQSVPIYLSKKVDHWGYNRGIEYYIPQDLNNYFNQRTPNASYLKIGLLDQIIYPTGGYTTFEYEPHSYNSIVNSAHTALLSESGIASGARIKRIIDNDGMNNIVRSFKYIQDYEFNHNSSISSGILSYKPLYYWPNWQYKTSTGGTLSLNIFSVNSIIPLANTYGLHIGYSKVIEERSDGSYTVYNYTNYGTNSYFDNGSICSLNNASQTSPFDKVSDLSSLRGKLTGVSLYNNNNEIIQQRIINYRNNLSALFQNDEYYVIGTNAIYKNVCSGSPTSAYKGASYKLYYFDYDIIQEETRDFIGSNYISNITSYTKNDISLTNSNIRLTNEVLKTISDGQIKTEYLYPTNLGMTKLIDDFRVDEVIKTRISKNSQYIGSKMLTYKTENNLYLPASMLVSNMDFTDLHTETTFDKYDNFGNLLQYTQNGGLTNSILWGYNDALPIAKISNAINKPRTLTNDPFTLSFQTAYGDPTTGTIFESTDITNVADNSTATLNLTTLLNPLLPSQPQTINFLLFNRTTQTSPMVVSLSTSQMSTTFNMTAGDYELQYSNKNPDAIVGGTFTYLKSDYLAIRECGYSGFENSESNSFRTYVGSFKNEPFTGKISFKVDDQSDFLGDSFIIGKNAENHSGYKASVWVKGSKSAYLYIEIDGYSDVNATSMNSEKEEEWHLLEVELPFVKIAPYFSDELKINVKISTSDGSALFDDLCFHPIDAQMSTYTYDPSVGLTSESESNRKPIIYEYDASGRLILLRDYIGNILKKYDYHYKP